jgi:hypothetical protein
MALSRFLKSKLLGVKTLVLSAHNHCQTVRAPNSTVRTNNFLIILETTNLKQARARNNFYNNDDEVITTIFSMGITTSSIDSISLIGMYVCRVVVVDDDDVHCCCGGYCCCVSINIRKDP